MAAYDDILAQIPIADLAQRVGVDEATAGSAVQQAIPTLLGGLGANASDPAGAASLRSAVAEHPASLVDGGVQLQDVDPADGEKIVHNIFGNNTDQVVNALGASTGGSGLVQKLLPMLAPIVLSYLAKRMGGGGAPTASGAAPGGDITDVIGDLLGAKPGSGSPGMNDLLGGLLGASGAQGGTGGGLADMLGGLLGGGKR
jgi:hypothetical protein